MDAPIPGRLALLALLIVTLAVGLLYTEALPPWEAPDEPWHMAYAEAMAAGRMPTAAETYEAHQPPLYYLWPVLALRAVGRWPLERGPDNPRFPFAAAAYLHPPGDSSVATLRLVRTFSGLLGALVVVLAWATARVALPGERARPLLAAGIAGLLPQFAFISHTVSNDVLAAAVGAWITYALMRLVMRPHELAPAAALLGVGLALALVTKLNVLALLPAVVLAAALAARRAHWAPRRVIGLAGTLCLVLIGMVILLGWRLPATAAALSRDALMRGLGVQPQLADPRLVAQQSERLLTSLWGRFGWLNVDFPAVVQLVWLVGLALAGWGCARAYLRAEERTRSALVLGVGILACLAAATVKNMIVDLQPQGRLLFPALAALGWLMAVGWTTFLPRARWIAMTIVITAVLVAANVYVTGWLLPRTYAASRRPVPPIDARRLPRQWIVAARLIAPFDVARQTFHAYRPGLNRVELPIARATGSGQLGLRVLAADGTELGTMTVDLASLRANDWVGVDVGPLPDSAGRAYALDLAVTDGSGSVWLWGAADGNDYPDGMLTVNGRAGTDLVLLSFAAGDESR